MNRLSRNILFVVVIGVLIIVALSVTLSRSTDTEKVLSTAIRNGDIKQVEVLLNKNPELSNRVTYRKPGLVSVLCYALRSKQPEIAKLLLSKGADPTINFGWKAPLQLAVYNGYADLIPLLIEKGDDPNRAISASQDVKTLRILLNHGANVNHRNNKDNGTPLHEIADEYIPNIELLEILISRGADVNAKDKYGRTPLHHASHRCKLKMVEFLIEHGADVNAINKSGRTPLQNLIINSTDSRNAPLINQPEFYTMTKLLISKGSHFTAVDLVRAGDLEGLKKLLKTHPEQIQMKDYWRDPLLFCAIREGHSQIVNYLIKQGADLNALGKHDEPALHAAAYAGNLETVKILLQRGVDVNQKGDCGELALHWAAGRRAINKDKEDSYDKIEKLLIESGSDLNITAREDGPDLNARTGQKEPVNQINEMFRFVNTNKRMELMGITDYQLIGPRYLHFGVGDTPLHSAARWGRINIVKQLIQAGAKIDPQNSLGQTPMHYAIAFQHVEVVKSLINAGANPKIKMNDGTSGLKLACKIDDKQIIELLKAK